MTGMNDYPLLVEIAHLYYDEGFNQDQIARKMNMSRSLVSKLLAKARKVGIVEIIVHPIASTPYKETEDRLRQLLGLHHVKITDSFNCQSDSAAQIQKEIAHYICNFFVDCKTVVVSASKNIQGVAKNISTHQTFPHVTFVPASGGLAELSWEGNANTNCSLFAWKTGAKSQQLYAPIVVDSKETKDVLCSQPFIRNVLRRGRSADLALVGIGGAYQPFALDEEYRKELNIHYSMDSSLIQGDVCFNYFDKKGDPLQCQWNDLLMGLSLEDFQNIPEVICFASESYKAESICVAANKHLITSLVTTDEVAKRLLHLCYGF